MHRIVTCIFMAVAVTLLASGHAVANLLTNPGFEDPITMDGPPFVGFWEGFSGGPGASANNAMVMPRTGAQHLDLSIVNTDNTFTGVFQDVTGLMPGKTGFFRGWHKTTTSPLDLDVEVRIEWRNSTSNTEVSRTPNSLPVPTSEYTPFQVSAAVPAGADTARLVYAIQTFSGGPTNNGTVFLDDMSFLVPEPVSLASLCIALISMFVARRCR